MAALSSRSSNMQVHDDYLSDDIVTHRSQQQQQQQHHHQEPLQHGTTNYVSMDYEQDPPRVPTPGGSTAYLKTETTTQQQPSDSIQRNNIYGDYDDPKQAYHGDESVTDQSTVLTAEGIHDVPGFLCVCAVILIGDMSRGVMFPTLWPLVESLGGTKVTLGYAVSAFSFGRVLVNPLFGSWSHQFGYTKTLCISMFILLLGTLVYAQVPNLGDAHYLILAQTIMGIGSGTLGVTRAFVADVTAKRERTTYMAWMTAVQYGGFTVTPFFGALFSHLLGGSDYSWGIWRLNMYTAPAYFMTIIAATILLVLITIFREPPHIEARSESQKTKSSMAVDAVANAVTPCFGLTVYDCCIFGCMLLNVATKGSIACFETLGIAIAESHFNMTEAHAGIVVATCGTVGVLALLSFGHFTAIWDDVQLIAGGMILMSIGVAILSTVEDDIVNPSWKYTLTIFLVYAIGYPVGHTAVIGIFSKIVGRRPQGTLLGWFASAGSIARMFFPIMSGYIADYQGVQLLFFYPRRCFVGIYHDCLVVTAYISASVGLIAECNQQHSMMREGGQESLLGVCFRGKPLQIGRRQAASRAEEVQRKASSSMLD